MKNEIYFYGRQESSINIGKERFVLHAPTTLLTTGNRLVNVNWQSSGFCPSSLMAIPALNWFSQKHKALLQFGGWNISLLLNGEKTNVHTSKTWHETQSILRSQFTLEGKWEQLLLVNAYGFCPPRESAFMYRILFSGLKPSVDFTIIVKINGLVRLGKEVGRLFDGKAGNIVPRGPGGAASISFISTGADIFQKDGGLFSRIYSNIETSARSFKVVSVQDSRNCDLVEFEFDYPVLLKGKKTRSFEFSIFLGNSKNKINSAEKCLVNSFTNFLNKTKSSWKDEAGHMLEVSMPVNILEAGFKQGLLYAKNNSHDFDNMTIIHADHCNFPLDLSRDSFYVSAALLYLNSEITKRHLRFYFEKAIPCCGVGISYVASCPWTNKPGHFLLDVVIYPVLELYRYWRFTGDNAFLESKKLRKSIDIILKTLQGAHSEETGLYRSEGRSSDESCVYPFFVPANMMLVVMFEQLSTMYNEVYMDKKGSSELILKAVQLRSAIETHCVKQDRDFGKVYAFEVDGKDKYLLYDHADIPNLLTTPWFGYCANVSEVYKNTLKFVYSSCNQGYKHVMDGRFPSLCDGSKTLPDGPWPMSAMGHILAGISDPRTLRKILDSLAASMGDNLLIPEIMDQHTGKTRSRRWFA